MTTTDFVLISQKEFANGGGSNPTKRPSPPQKCWFCKQDRKKCIWPDGQEKCERCQNLEYSCSYDAPSNQDSNRRVLSKYKCSLCREARQKCLPVDRVWPQHCYRCISKGLDCSEPQASLNARMRSPPGTPTAATLVPILPSAQKRSKAENIPGVVHLGNFRHSNFSPQLVRRPSPKPSLQNRIEIHNNSPRERESKHVSRPREIENPQPATVDAGDKRSYGVFEDWSAPRQESEAVTPKVYIEDHTLRPTNQESPATNTTKPRYSFASVVEEVQRKRSRPGSFYQPLKKDEFRVIALQPHSPYSEERDEIECELRVWRGEPFEAVSYVWGSYNGEEEDITILVSSEHSTTSLRRHRFSLRRNQVAILRSLQYKDRPRLLWVDAICMDMIDHDERSQQIYVMPHIFSRASNVCICLADPSPDLACSLKPIQDLIKLDGSEEDWHRGDIENLVAMKNLLNNEVFRRRWVVQEIALARHATIHCGTESIAFDDFTDAIAILQRLEEHRPAIKSIRGSKALSREYDPEELGLADINNFSAVNLVSVTSHMFRRTSRGDISRKLLSLEKLVCGLTFSSCTEPKDVIYSLLGLANDVELPRLTLGYPYNSHSIHAVPTRSDSELSSKADKEGLITQKPSVARAAQQFLKLLKPKHSFFFPVNYDKSTLEVYREFVYRTVLLTGSLDILVRPWAPNLENLPSWMPSIDSGPFRTSETGQVFRANADSLVGSLGPALYSASGTFKGSCELLSDVDPFALRVKGVFFSSITQIRSEAMEGNIPWKWFQLANWDDDSIDPPEEVWRTLTADRSPAGQSAPLYYRRALGHARQSTPRGMPLKLERIANSPSKLVSDLATRLQQVVFNRKLVRLQNGALGLVPESAESGDLLVVLYGCSVPVCLRESDVVNPDGKRVVTFVIVGEAYIHGIMNGEGIPEGSSMSDAQEFVLV